MSSRSKSRKKKDLDLDIDKDHSNDEINNLPENILLEILRCLPVKERCIAGRVCRKWRRVVADNSLWRHVDLLPYRLDLTKMWRVLRAHFSPCLLTIKIRGFTHSGSLKSKKASVSDAMLKELSTRCPNLWSLRLHDCNTDHLSFENIPVSVTLLGVTSSSWTPRWIKGKQSHLPHLTDLDLSATVRVDKFDLEDIAVFTGLRKFSIQGCYRVKGSDVQVLVKAAPSLEFLNIGGTDVDDLGIHHIARHLTSLKELLLSGCQSISDGCLATLASGTPSLEVLDLSDCALVTLDGLKCLHSLRNLRVVTARRPDNPWTQKQITVMKNGFVQQVQIIVC